MNDWFQYPFSLIEEHFLLLEKAKIEAIDNAFFVDFYVSPSFSNAYRLLLVWEQEAVFCLKLTLVSDTEIEVQEGHLAKEKGVVLLEMLQKLQIPFHLYKSGQARDGNIYRLCFGQDSSRLSLQWWDANLPPGWEDIENIAAYLSKLPKTAEWEKSYVLSYSLERDGKSSLLNEEKQLYMSFKKK